jgi:hypothetical protein
MTGRAAGYCAGYGAPGWAGVAPGRGYGYGRGWGMGAGWGRGGGRGAGWRHRNWYYATGLPGWVRAGYGPAWGPPPVDDPYAGPTPEHEVEFLRQQAEWLKQQLDAIGQRIGELEREE